MSIIQRVPWRVQPPPGARPIPGRFKSVWVGSSSSRTLLTNEATLFSTTNVTTSPTAQGIAAVFTHAINTKIRLAADADSMLGTAATTFAVLRRCIDTTNRDSTIFGYQLSNTDVVQAVVPFTDGNLYFDYGDNSVGRVSVTYTKDTAWETLVFVAGPRKGREIWRRGVKLLGNTSANSARPATTAEFNLGAKASGTSSGDNQEIALFAVSDYEWSDAQIQAWCRFPYAETFAPQTRRIWVPASAGGGGTPVGLATETDTAQTLAGVQLRAAGLSTESDSALALAAVASTAVGVAAETDTALALSALQLKTVGTATEVDTALALDVGTTGGVGVALETDVALNLAGSQQRAVGLATEADTALALTLVQSRAVEVASESDSAFALTAVQKMLVGVATEIDSALSVGSIEVPPETSQTSYGGGGGGGHVGAKERLRTRKAFADLFEDIKLVKPKEKAPELTKYQEQTIQHALEVVREAQEAVRQTLEKLAEASPLPAQLKALQVKLRQLESDLEEEEAAVISLLLL